MSAMRTNWNIALHSRRATEFVFTRLTLRQPRGSQTGRQSKKPQHPTDRGNYTYYVQTRTGRQQSSRSSSAGKDAGAYAQGINIVAEKYDTSTLIERRGGAQRMTVEVFNNGTVGSEREVNLTITNKSDGSAVFTGSTNVTVGSGDLRDVDKYPAWAGYDTDLDPGYYTYEVTVYNDTASGSIDDTATGEIYLKEVDESGATTNDSPISIDSDTITIGS